MRKRKSPIALVTVLVVLVAGVAGSQFAANRKAGPEAPPAAPPVADNSKTLGDKRAPASPTDVASKIKTQMGGSSGGGDHRSAMAPHEGESSGPMVLAPAGSQADPQKPKPNTSSTSTQWYNDESANGSKKD